MFINTGLIGFPLTHSLSPMLHSHFFDITGLNGGYCCFEVSSPSLLPATLDMLKGYSFAGFNITVPYKTAIMELCDEIHEDAENVGAVNTVLLKQGVVKGYNTDVFGFSKMLEDAKISLKDKRVLLLGAGGAAKAVISYMNSNMPKYLKIANRTIEKAEKLVADCQFEAESEAYIGNLVNLPWDIVINSTSIGLRGEMFPDLDIKCGEAAIDLQYKKSKTPFLASIKTDCKKVDGMGMLIWQACKSFEIWTGKACNPDMKELQKKINLFND